MTYVPYPDMSDPDAYDKLFRKKEFVKTRYGPEFPYSKTEDICKTGEFNLQYHQEFVRNLISPETPYNSLILLHGTGVGKTCAAIGITEGLRDYVHKNNKKIYILSSENVRPNFYKELYSEKRAEIERRLGSPAGSYQCAGNRYYLETENQRKALISQYYEFYGFGQFANYVDVHLKASGKDVADVFANSIIIIDEAHGISVQEHVEEQPGKKGGLDLEKIRGIIAEEYSLDASDTMESLFPTLTKRLLAGEKVTKSEILSSLADVLDEDPSDAFIDRLVASISNSAAAPTAPKKTRGRKPKTPATGAKEGKEEDEELIIDDDVEIKQERKARNVSDRTLFEVLTKTIIPETQKKHGTGLKIIMLTATPMKDNITEIADLLEVAVSNDGVALEKTWRRRLFPSEDSFDQKFLKKLAKGYISYVRGNNPISFPDTLVPPAIQVYEPSPVYDYNDNQRELTTEFNIQLAPGVRYSFDLFKCPMDLYQFKCYMSLRHSTGVIDQSDSRARMLSNIAFPLKRNTKDFTLGSTLLTDTDLQTIYGSNGFKSCFKVSMAPDTKWKIYSYQPDILKAYGPFLNIDNARFPLAYFSSKMDKFCRTVNMSPGIAYVYSEFINAGALMAAMVLENNGWIHYTPEIKNHILPTGVPREDIDQIVPTCRLFRGYRGEFRCGRCGKYSSQCLRDKEHEFKVATYVLVTGEQGGAANIEYANLPENKYGDVVKAVIGTKVTGQGVDFKWIRQVHILDPWHNNTRIYQAIGRGARHCSHADLKPEERNVTVYKYCSSVWEAAPKPPKASSPETPVTLGGESLGITYRDLKTETIDEHMYARIIRKDILVKRIERCLKEMAVDCEFNRNRNMFAGDKDYSRDCDYMKCRYTCDGYSTPIKYTSINIIKKDGKYFEGDGDASVAHLVEIPAIKRMLLKLKTREDAAIWMALRRMGGKIIMQDGYERLLLDIPDIKVDTSTYDAYFIQPQVARTIKTIMALFKSKIIMTADSILSTIKQMDPASEDQFVYLALDQLIGEPPKIKPMGLTDMYGRQGYLIYRGRFYIFQPDDISDESIPLRYRSKLLKVKPRVFKTQIIRNGALSKPVVPTVPTDEVKLTVKLSRQLSIIDTMKIFTAIDALDMAGRFALLEGTIRTTPTDPITDFKIQCIIEYFIRNWVLFFIGGRHGVPVYLGLNETARFFKNGEWADVIPGSQIHTDLEMEFENLQTMDTGNDNPLNTELFGFMATAKVKNFITTGQLSLSDWMAMIQRSAEEPNRDTKFKIFRKIETEKKTKTGVKSKKPQARGLVCTSFVKSAKEQLQLELWNILHASVPQVKQDDVGIISQREATGTCSDVELLFRLLDYYRVQGFRWYLNNIAIQRFMR